MPKSATDPSIGTDQHVAGLDVAEDDSLGLHVGQRRRDLRTDQATRPDTVGCLPGHRQGRAVDSSIIRYGVAMSDRTAVQDGDRPSSTAGQRPRQRGSGRVRPRCRWSRSSSPRPDGRRGRLPGRRRPSLRCRHPFHWVALGDHPAVSSGLAVLTREEYAHVCGLGGLRPGRSARRRPQGARGERHCSRPPPSVPYLFASEGTGGPPRTSASRNGLNPPPAGRRHDDYRRRSRAGVASRSPVVSCGRRRTTMFVR